MSTINFDPKTSVAPKTSVESAEGYPEDPKSSIVEVNGEEEGSFVDAWNEYLTISGDQKETTTDPDDPLELLKAMVIGETGDTPNTSDFGVSIGVPTLEEVVAMFPGHIVEIQEQYETFKTKCIEAMKDLEKRIKTQSFTASEIHTLQLRIEMLDKAIDKINSYLAQIPALVKAQEATYEAEMKAFKEYGKALWEYENGVINAKPDYKKIDLNGDQRVGRTNYVFGVKKDSDGKVIDEGWIDKETMTFVKFTKTGTPYGGASSFVDIDKTLIENGLDLLTTGDADINTQIAANIDVTNSDNAFQCPLAINVGEYVYAEVDEETGEFKTQEGNGRYIIAPINETPTGGLKMEAPDSDKYKAVRIAELSMQTVEASNWKDLPFGQWDDQAKKHWGGDILITAKDEKGKTIFTWRITGRNAKDLTKAGSLQGFYYKKDPTKKEDEGQWIKQEVYDDKGNFIKYEYTKIIGEAKKFNTNYVSASSLGIAVVDSLEEVGKEDLDARETPLILNTENYISTASHKMSSATMKEYLTKDGGLTGTEADNLINDEVAGYTLKRFLSDNNKIENDPNQGTPVSDPDDEVIDDDDKTPDQFYIESLDYTGVFAYGVYSFKGGSNNDFVVQKEPSKADYEKDSEGYVHPAAMRYANLGSGMNAYIASGGWNFVKGATFTRIWEGENPDPTGDQINEVSVPEDLAYYNYYAEVGTDPDTGLTIKGMDGDMKRTNPRVYVDVETPDGKVFLGNPTEEIREDGAKPDNLADPYEMVKNGTKIEDAKDFPQNDRYNITGELWANDTKDFDLWGKSGKSAEQWSNTKYTESGNEERKKLEKFIKEPEKYDVELLGKEGYTVGAVQQEIIDAMAGFFAEWEEQVGVDSVLGFSADEGLGEDSDTTYEDEIEKTKEV